MAADHNRFSLKLLRQLSQSRARVSTREVRLNG